MFCHECGRRFLSYHNFCSYCGADLKEEKKTYSEEYGKLIAKLEKMTWEEIKAYQAGLREKREATATKTVDDWNFYFELQDVYEVKDSKFREWYNKKYGANI